MNILENSETLAHNWIKSFVEELDNIEKFYVNTLDQKIKKFIKL